MVVFVAVLVARQGFARAGRSRVDGETPHMSVLGVLLVSPFHVILFLAISNEGYERDL